MSGFWEAFDPAGIVLDLRAADRDAVLPELLGILVAGRRLSKKEGERALAALRKREELGTTGIGGGLAIPHVKLAGVERPIAALGVSPRGLDYRSLDGAPVRVVFLVVRPEAQEEEHLRFLRWLSSLARHPDFVRFVVRAGSVDEIVAILREFSEPGP